MSTGTQRVSDAWGDDGEYAWLDCVTVCAEKEVTRASDEVEENPGASMEVARYCTVGRHFDSLDTSRGTQRAELADAN